jgi:hypothetical protein
MSSSSPDLGRRDRFEDRSFSELASDPEFRIVVDQVAAEKKAALAHPGPSWREWALQSALKWYLGLGFLIADGLLIDTWIVAGLPLGLLTLAPVVYAEYLAWQYLWYRPEEAGGGPHRHRRVRWIHPVRHGRWTPEAEKQRKGELIPTDQPNPAEFL